MQLAGKRVVLQADREELFLKIGQGRALISQLQAAFDQDNLGMESVLICEQFRCLVLTLHCGGILWSNRDRAISVQEADIAGSGVEPTSYRSRQTRFARNAITVICFRPAALLNRLANHPSKPSSGVGAAVTIGSGGEGSDGGEKLHDDANFSRHAPRLRYDARCNQSQLWYAGTPINWKRKKKRILQKAVKKMDRRRPSPRQRFVALSRCAAHDPFDCSSHLARF